MGFLSNMFGGKQHYPALDPGSAADEKMKKVSTSIESLASSTKEPLEVVPAGENAFVYIGKPPKHFGVAWVEQGKIKSFKMLAEEKGLNPSETTNLQEQLRSAYERHQDEPRYIAKVAGREVVVIHSSGLEEDVKGIISKATH